MPLNRRLQLWGLISKLLLVPMQAAALLAQRLASSFDTNAIRWLSSISGGWHTL